MFQRFNLTQSKKGYLLRVSLSDSCNYRCVFCRPHNLIPKNVLSDDNLLKIIREICALYQIKTIHFTGGEPLLRREISNIVGQCRNFLDDGVDIALTTNGSLLYSQIDDLVKAGLTRINISLHSLNPEHYARITGSNVPIDRIKKTISRSVEAGLVVKTNSVIIREYNDNDIIEILQFCFDVGAIPRFSELGLYGPVKTWFSNQNVLKQEEIISNIESYVGNIVPDLNCYGNGPSKYYRTLDNKLFGIINIRPINKCIGCDRLRLSSNGKIRACMFDGIDLSDALDSNTAIRNILLKLQRQLKSKGSDYIGKHNHFIDYNYRWNIEEKD